MSDSFEPVSIESSAHESEFDPSIPMEILRDYGPEQLRELLAVFRAEAPGPVEVACLAVAAGNAEEAAHAGHFLKSSAASMGATGLARLCAELDVLGRSGSLVGAAPIAAALGPSLATALEQMAMIEAALPSA